MGSIHVSNSEWRPNIGFLGKVLVGWLLHPVTSAGNRRLYELAEEDGIAVMYGLKTDFMHVTEMTTWLTQGKDPEDCYWFSKDASNSDNTRKRLRSDRRPHETLSWFQSQGPFYFLPFEEWRKEADQEYQTQEKMVASLDKCVHKRRAKKTTALKRSPLYMVVQR